MPVLTVAAHVPKARAEFRAKRLRSANGWKLCADGAGSPAGGGRADRVWAAGWRKDGPLHALPAVSCHPWTSNQRRESQAGPSTTATPDMHNKAPAYTRRPRLADPSPSRREGFTGSHLDGRPPPPCFFNAELSRGRSALATCGASVRSSIGCSVPGSVWSKKKVH